MFTIQRCSPKRDEICSCTHMPAIHCTQIKNGSAFDILKGIHQVAEPFSMTVFLSFYVMIFLDFLYRYRLQYMYFS